MKVEINVNDQLFVNNKWYFDVININDNIVQVMIQYKETPSSKNYEYKAINLDKSIFTNVEEISNTNIKRVQVNQKQLRNIIGNLITRIRVEMDYSFMFEAHKITEDGDGGAASAANTAGMGDVSMPGLSGIPGVQSTAGSGDISTSLSPIHHRSAHDLFGTQIKKKKKKKKKKKPSKKSESKLPAIKKPVIQLESVNLVNIDADYKSDYLNLINRPTQNEYEIAFISDMLEKKNLLMGRSKEVISNYISNLIKLNKTLFNKCSDTFKSKLQNLNI